MALGGEAPTEGSSTAYWILFLQGLGNLFPWNTFITASHYFNMRFCGTPYQTGFENYFSVVTNMSQVLGLIFSIRYLEKIPLKYCVLGPIALSTVVMIVSNIFVVITSISRIELFTITLVSCAFFGLNSAISGGGIFGLSGCLPPAYTGAVMCGQGLGGVVVSIASILTIYYSPIQNFCSSHKERPDKGFCPISVDWSAFFFFATCCSVLVLCFATFFALLVLPFTRYYQERVSVDLMRGFSLDDLHKELVRHGSEGLLDRMTMDKDDSCVTSVPNPNPKLLSQRYISSATTERLPLLTPQRRPRSNSNSSHDCKILYGSECGRSDLDSEDWLIGSHSRGRAVRLDSMGESEEWNDMEHHLCCELNGKNRGLGVSVLGASKEMLCNVHEAEPPPGIHMSPAVAHHHNTSFKAVFYQIYPASTAIFLTFLCTLSVFPSHTVLLQSQYRCHPKSSRLQNDLFTPLLFLVFYMSDLFGRTIPNVSHMGINVNNLWVIVWLRFICIPLFLFCRVENSYLPLLFEADMWPALFIFIFAASNGFISTLAMMFGPQMVSARKSPIAGSVMILSLNIGLCLGSVLSFVVLQVSSGYII